MAEKNKAKKVARKKPSRTLSTRFTPQFWEQADSRLAIVREIRSRHKDLIRDTGADSMQKDILCQRIVFLTVWIETQERKAIEDGDLNAGSYVQAVNSLLGLLRTVGLERQAKQIANLKQYVEGKAS